MAPKKTEFKPATLEPELNPEMSNPKVRTCEACNAIAPEIEELQSAVDALKEFNTSHTSVTNKEADEEKKSLIDDVRAIITECHSITKANIKIAKNNIGIAKGLLTAQAQEKIDLAEKHKIGPYTDLKNLRRVKNSVEAAKRAAMVGVSDPLKTPFEDWLAQLTRVSKEVIEKIQTAEPIYKNAVAEWKLAKKELVSVKASAQNAYDQLNLARNKAGLILPCINGPKFRAYGEAKDHILAADNCITLSQEIVSPIPLRKDGVEVFERLVQLVKKSIISKVPETVEGCSTFRDWLKRRDMPNLNRFDVHENVRPSELEGKDNCHIIPRSMIVSYFLTTIEEVQNCSESSESQISQLIIKLAILQHIVTNGTKDITKCIAAIMEIQSTLQFKTYLTGLVTEAANLRKGDSSTNRAIQNRFDFVVDDWKVTHQFETQLIKVMCEEANSIELKKIKPKFPIVRNEKISAVNADEWLTIEDTKYYPTPDWRTNAHGYIIAKNRKKDMQVTLLAIKSSCSSLFKMVLVDESGKPTDRFIALVLLAEKSIKAK